MKKLLLILFMVFFAFTANADILIYEDFEDALSTTYWKVSNCTQGDNVGEISSTYAYNGSSSWHAYVQPFDTSEYGATNCSIGPQNYAWMGGTNNFQFGTEYWVGYAIYIPTANSWPDITNILGDGQGEWQLLYQWHGIIEACDDANLNPPIAHFLDETRSDGSLEISILGDANECVDKPNYDRSVDYDYSDDSNLIFTKPGWNIVVENFQFSYTTGGFYKLWINGNQVVDDTGINCYNHAKGPYLMIGPYGHMETGVHYYYDEFRVGDENSSYAEVLPQGGATDEDPPIISAGSPSGTLTSGTTSTTISCTTNENATCKYGVVADTAYASIANTFSETVAE